MSKMFPGLQARLAIVTSVDHGAGIAQTRWMDGDEIGPSIPIPHPFSGRGEGLYVGLRTGSLVALVQASNARFIPVAIIPLRGFYSPDLSDIDETYFDDIGLPIINDGDIIAQGATGSQIRLGAEGSVSLYNSMMEGLLIGGDQDDAHRCSISRLPPVAYLVSQTGIDARGIVRRDMRPNEESLDAAAYDLMFDLDAEQLFEEVGRNPAQDVTHGTTSGSTAIFRNPPFVEKRSTIYEFGTEWNVDVRQEEERMLREGILPVRVFSERRQRRDNI